MAAESRRNSSGHPVNGVRPGERRGGRQKGTPNKVTADNRAAARLHADDELGSRRKSPRHGQSETARISACKEILDRAYGKSPQAVTGEDGEGPQHISISWADDGNRKSVFDDFLREAASVAASEGDGRG